MNSKNDAIIKLLHRTRPSEPVREERAGGASRAAMLSNVGIALVTAALLAFALLPQVPQAGAVRPHVYGGLVSLVLVFFYLFYRNIRRYRPALVSDTRKLFLLALLLLLTVALTQYSKYFFFTFADKFQLDLATIGFALPVAAGAMLVSLLLDFHLALGFSFVVSILLGISFQGDPFVPVYYFLCSIVAALSVIQCKKRTAVLKAGALTALVSFVVISRHPQLMS